MTSPIFTSLVSSRPTVRFLLLAAEARSQGLVSLAAAMDTKAGA